MIRRPEPDGLTFNIHEKGDNMEAIIYGVGVGPGDPEEMTLKAVNTIRKADILYLPQQPEECRAYQIVKQVIPDVDQKEIISCDFSMSHDISERKARHREIYAAVRAQIEQGRSVAFLTIGDPGMYSTFSYIADLAVEDGIKTKPVSGISSVSACAARLGICLCRQNEQLHIIPDAKDLETALDYPGCKVIMKCGNDLSAIRKSLETHAIKSGEKMSVYAVSECGMPQERVYPDTESLPDAAGYLTTVFVISQGTDRE